MAVRAKSSQGKARVAAPYAQPNRPVTRAKDAGAKAAKSLPTATKNTTVTEDATRRITKIDWSKGADEPMTDLQRAAKTIKMFKQAELMTVEKAGWKHNPVRQDIDEAWGRFAGQEQR